MNYFQTTDKPLFTRHTPLGCNFYCRKENEVVNFFKTMTAQGPSVPPSAPITPFKQLKSNCKNCDQKQPTPPPSSQPSNSYINNRNYAQQVENTCSLWQTAPAQHQQQKPQQIPQPRVTFEFESTDHTKYCQASNGQSCPLNLQRKRSRPVVNSPPVTKLEPQPQQVATYESASATYKHEKNPPLVNKRVIVVPRVPPKVKVVAGKVKYLGVFNADPDEYVKKYGPTLMMLDELPSYALDLTLPVAQQADMSTNYYPMPLPSAHTSYDDRLKRFLDTQNKASSPQYHVREEQKPLTKSGIKNRTSRLVTGERNRPSSCLSCTIRDIFEFVDVKNIGVVRLNEACQFVPQFDPARYDIASLKFMLGMDHREDFIDFLTFQKLYMIFRN
jgi:hypothetical protein